MSIAESSIEQDLRRKYRFVLPPSHFPRGRAFVNPYLHRLADFEQRIFLFEDFATERDRVRSLLESFERVVIEIGSGSGGHLVERASADAETLHVGFELRYKRAVKTLEKAEKRGLKNLCVLLIDGKALCEIFPPESCAQVYLNFPDPWDRKKWRKNRMVSESFLRDLSVVLQPGGSFSFKTDHAEYFDSSVKLIEENSGFDVQIVCRDLHRSEWRDGNVETEFEKLFRAQALPIHYLLAKKRNR